VDDHRLKDQSKNPALDELISLKEAAEISGLSPRHVRLLVSRGILWGKKMGRDWFTTSRAIREYMAVDRHPGPKTKKAPEISS
jgi:hypothetical protein